MIFKHGRISVSSWLQYNKCALIRSVGVQTTGILLVDDFQLCRQFVVSILRDIPNLQILSQGIKWSRRCRASQAVAVRFGSARHRHRPSRAEWLRGGSTNTPVLPKSKMLFLNQESNEFVLGAFGSGAHGYPLKAHPEAELLTAIYASSPALSS